MLQNSPAIKRVSVIVLIWGFRRILPTRSHQRGLGRFRQAVPSTIPPERRIREENKTRPKGAARDCGRPLHTPFGPKFVSTKAPFPKHSISP